MNDIKIEVADWTSEKHLLMQVRTKVFIEEQHVPASMELDDQDVQSTHIKAMTIDEKVIGTARLLSDCSIGRMCVLKEYRNTGVGSQLLTFFIDLARAKRFTYIHLNAQINALAFYQKFGFKQDSEIFKEAGIDHVHMILPFRQ